MYNISPCLGKMKGCRRNRCELEGKSQNQNSVVAMCSFRCVLAFQVEISHRLLDVHGWTFGERSVWSYKLGAGTKKRYLKSWDRTSSPRSESSAFSLSTFFISEDVLVGQDPASASSALWSLALLSHAWSLYSLFLLCYSIYHVLLQLVFFFFKGYPLQLDWNFFMG